MGKYKVLYKNKYLQCKTHEKYLEIGENHKRTPSLVVSILRYAQQENLWKKNQVLEVISKQRNKKKYKRTNLNVFYDDKIIELFTLRCNKEPIVVFEIF